MEDEVVRKSLVLTDGVEVMWPPPPDPEPSRRHPRMRFPSLRRLPSPHRPRPRRTRRVRRRGGDAPAGCSTRPWVPSPSTCAWTHPPTPAPPLRAATDRVCACLLCRLAGGLERDRSAPHATDERHERHLRHHHRWRNAPGRQRRGAQSGSGARRHCDSGRQHQHRRGLLSHSAHARDVPGRSDVAPMEDQHC